MTWVFMFLDKLFMTILQNKIVTNLSLLLCKKKKLRSRILITQKIQE